MCTQTDTGSKTISRNQACTHSYIHRVTQTHTHTHTHTHTQTHETVFLKYVHASIPRPMFCKIALPGWY